MIFALGTLISSSVYAQQCDTSGNENQVRACIGQELRNSDRVINDLYARVMATRDHAKRIVLRNQQRAWLKERTDLCHLDSRIYNREAWIDNILSDDVKTVCVVHLTRSRIAALRAMQHSSVAPAPLQAPQPSHLTYDRIPSTPHTSGKWYFEVTLNKGAIAAIMPTLIVLGVSDGHHATGTMENITSHPGAAESERIGIAADLDNGKLYIRRNGAWVGGAPGSARGTDLKLGQKYFGVFMVSAVEQQQQMLTSGALVPNFGGRPFAYTLPDGYRPWNDQNLR